MLLFSTMAISTSKKKLKDCNQVNAGKYLHCQITWFEHQISFRDLLERCSEKSVWNASQRRISTIKIFSNMSGNLSLLTVLFIMCYFIKKGRNYAVTTITRGQRDYFTDVCKNCYKYGAVLEQGICKCKPTSSTAGLGSLFLRYERHCKNEDDLMREWIFLCCNMHVNLPT